jgi:hypothetical protein
MPIDYNNNQQVEDAVIEHISSVTAVWMMDMADVSTDDSICRRIHQHYRKSVRDHRPPGMTVAVKAALGRLYAAGRLWSRRHITRDGEHQLWYGLPPTTDDQRTKWAAFDQRLAEKREENETWHAARMAERAAERMAEEEPAAEEGEE